VRTIREEELARRSVDAALARWSRAMDAWEAITWIIPHDVAAGSPVTERGDLRTYTFEGVGALDMPTVTVLYEVADDQIIIHDARFTEPRHTGLGHA
jgi:hypothetical protein